MRHPAGPQAAPGETAVSAEAEGSPESAEPAYQRTTGKAQIANSKNQEPNATSIH